MSERNTFAISIAMNEDGMWVVGVSGALRFKQEAEWLMRILHPLVELLPEKDTTEEENP